MKIPIPIHTEDQAEAAEKYLRESKEWVDYVCGELPPSRFRELIRAESRATNERLIEEINKFRRQA